MNLSDVVQYLDSVNGSTVIMVLVAIFLAYLGVRKACSVAYNLVVAPITSIFTAFPVAYSTAGLSFLLGLIGAGYGVGELTSGPPNAKKEHTVLTNDELVKLATNKDVSRENLNAVLEYAKARNTSVVVRVEGIAKKDGKDTKEVQTVSLDPSILSVVQEQQQKVSVEEPREPQITEAAASHRLGWFSLIGGIGSAIMGIVIFLVKFNA